MLFWRNILFIGINKNKNSINWNIYYIRKVEIIELLTGRIYIVDILPLEKSDYKSLTKSRYFFNWKEELEFELYKLTIKGHQDILGLISFEKYPEEWRIHVRLLTVSIENKGLNKMYDMMCDIHNYIYEPMAVRVGVRMFNVKNMYVSINVYPYYTPFIYRIYKAVCTV